MRKVLSSSQKKMIIAAIAIMAAVFVGILALAIYRNNRMVKAPETVNDEYRDFPVPTEEQLNNGKLNICLITKTYGNGYWDNLIEGVIDSARDNDVNLYVAGAANEGNTQRLALLMEEALEMKPDAIIVSPNDTPRINEIVDKINEQDIPLIFVDTILNGKEFDACYMTDNMQAGRMVARDMIQKLRFAGYSANDKLTVGISIGSRQSQTIIERLAGVNEFWTSNAPANWKIVDTIKCNSGNIDVAYEQCLELFDENPNLAGLIGLNNGSTVGLCRGLVEKERKDVVLVGFDYSDDIAALIEGGEYHVSTMVQRQYNMGYGSVEAAIDICNGEEPMYKFFNTGISMVDHSNYNSPYVKKKVLMQE